jgi:hypothetical protein
MLLIDRIAIRNSDFPRNDARESSIPYLNDKIEQMRKQGSSAKPVSFEEPGRGTY